MRNIVDFFCASQLNSNPISSVISIIIVQLFLIFLLLVALIFLSLQCSYHIDCLVKEGFDPIDCKCEKVLRLENFIIWRV